MASTTVEPAAPVQRHGRAARLWKLTVANAVFLLGVHISHVYVAERFWLSMFLTYCPQLLFLTPTAVLVALSLRRTTRPQLVLNLAAAVFGLWGVAGLVWHPWVRSGDAPRIRVMTYNIEGGKVGFDRVAATVKRQAPDVLCLQEAGNMHGILQGMLPEYSFRQEGGIAIASRLPIVESHAFSLPPGQKALVVTVDRRGENVQIVALHLIPTNIDHDAFHGPTAIARSMTRTRAAHATQMKALLEGTLPVAGALLVCGDFNAPPYGVQYGRLTDHFTDCFAASGRGFGCTVPAVAPFIRIDFVFCRGGLRPADAWVPSDISSDHRAVVCEVEGR